MWSRFQEAVLPFPETQADPEPEDYDQEVTC